MARPAAVAGGGEACDSESESEARGLRHHLQHLAVDRAAGEVGRRGGGLQDPAEARDVVVVHSVVGGGSVGILEEVGEGCVLD